MSQFARRLAERFAAPEGRARIVVEAWRGVLEDDSEGDPAVYARMITAREAASLRELGAEPGADFAAEVVLKFAENEAGERLFDRGDKATILGAMPESVLIGLAAVIGQNVDAVLSGVPPVSETRAAGEHDPQTEKEVGDRRISGEEQGREAETDRGISENDGELQSLIHEGDPFG